MYVNAGARQCVGRVMAEMVGEASVVVLWVCHWYTEVDGILLFSDSGKLASFRVMVPLN